MRALIVGADDARGAVAATRALAAAGWWVGVGSPAGGGLAGASRHAAARHRLPGPEAAGFLAAVGLVVRAGRYDVVLPCGDAEALALSAGRDALPDVVPYGPHRSVEVAFDKLLATQAAAAAGLAVPRTAAPDDAAAPPPPVVVKPRRHVGASAPRAGTTVCRDPAAVTDATAALRRAGWEPLVQELVAGPLLALSVVLDADGDAVAVAQQRTDRMWPPGAGISARATTTPVDDDLLGRAVGFLHGIGWIGLAELQFLDPGDGPRLVDVNGRCYGSLALAVAAGANLPAAWAAVATGRPPPRGRAVAGVRYQWLAGDVRRALRERRGGLLRDLADCARQAPGAVHSVADRRDPAPAARYAWRLVATAVRRAREGAA